MTKQEKMLRTEERVKMVAELLARGHSVLDIAKVLECGEGVVRYCIGLIKNRRSQ